MARASGSIETGRRANLDAKGGIPAGLSPGFVETVAAICDCIVLARLAPDATELCERRTELTRFLLAQQGRMPDYLRRPFRLATLFFDLFGLLIAGRRFRSQGQGDRGRQIQLWRNARFFPPAGDLVRFYESLVLYHWYSDHER